MQLTKFTHSCVRLDEGGRSLVIDPGVFSEVDEALDGAQAVLITHEHQDHVDGDRLKGALKRDPRLQVWAPRSVAGALGEFGEQIVAVGPGETLEAGGFAVRTFGGQHAVIHSSIPVVTNVAYLVADAMYHPGDSFTVPAAEVGTLLAPVHAPWSKISEVIDFVIAVRARRVHQIHDGLLNDIGLGMVEGHVTRFGAEHGSEFSHLAVRDSVSL